ncbi:ParB N-terminal domain-containing protein [Reinekea sp. G2M2-21]|uniref:ParB N-terminal domain-containing protein n=1 Tax=Reinekea sp. G2M2-21 TaxID=2788942 RepID=UPI0018AC4B76|nr:ParB N-terminal domain-containing protein [Reinekea sp. G2M2-21]
MSGKTTKPFEDDLDLDSLPVTPSIKPTRKPNRSGKGALGAIDALSNPLAGESQLDKARREKRELAVKLEEVQQQLAEKSDSSPVESAKIKEQYESQILEIEEQLKAKANLVTQMESELAKMQTALESKTVTQTMVMPVTRTEVTFTLMELEPDSVTVSGENARNQEFLTEETLSDILPSIREVRQYDAGYVSNTNPDQLTLCDGSRRKAAAKIASKKFLAWVGNIPEEDMHELSEVLNKSKVVSYWERAKHIQFLINKGIFDSWRKAMDIYALSRGNSDRYKKLAELDNLYVHCFPTPNDVPLNFGEIISKLEKFDLERARETAIDTREKKNEMLKHGVAKEDVINHVIKSFKAVEVRRSPVKTSYISSTGLKAASSLKPNGLVSLKIDSLTDAQTKQLLEWLGEAFDLRETDKK